MMKQLTDEKRRQIVTDIKIGAVVRHILDRQDVNARSADDIDGEMQYVMGSYSCERHERPGPEDDEQ